uniref:Ribosomal protein L16 n=1 Tax=Pleurocladia lacustris TaxID=246121 RepID=A0A1I9LW99_9PHAE|nr:ribosomal protein L16 [Pleurocladia lacustris]ANS57827.1 ribosomal protein L16 [Pleurocladia lacustris]ANS57869.1 ribosomal protein L16 [Pleurocladia lacustris]
MLTQPKKTKYRKYFKPRQMPNNSTKTHKLQDLNCFALVAMESSFLNGKQIEAARQNIRRKVNRKGKLEIIIFPDIAISRKATAARMGKGKGKVDHWVASLSAGQTVFLLYGIDAEQGIPALQAGANKLPMKLKIYQL